MTEIVIFPPETAALLGVLQFPEGRMIVPVPLPATGELFLIKTDLMIEQYRTAWPLIETLEIRSLEDWQLTSTEAPIQE
jgi:hypothetical protein